MQTAELIELALQEDLASGDITSNSIFEHDDPKIVAVVKAKQSGIICGIDFFTDTYKRIDSEVEVEILKSNGHYVELGDDIIRLRGKSSSILKGERTALNFLGKLSGIASLTHQFVKKIEHSNAKILDTRKTTPAYRLLEKFAVRIGGGKNHRFGLYDMIMIKDNHIDACGSITKAVERSRRYLEKQKKEQIKIEVEVKNQEELKEALACQVDRIMLDNMSLDEMKKAVELVDGKIELEASGNVDLDTVAGIAETGVDFISIGKLTHSASSFDFSMRLGE